MLVEQLMTRPVQSCRSEDTLAQAARLMWERDCGCLPVCGGNGTTHVIGVITDRDICMCAMFEGRPLQDLRVAAAMSRQVRSCRTTDTVDDAERIMRESRIRRLPVIDSSGMLVGMIALADLAQEAVREHASTKRDVTDTEIGGTLAAICRPLGHELVAAVPPPVAAEPRAGMAL